MLNIRGTFYAVLGCRGKISELYSLLQVNKVLRNHNIKPHWMFALDSIIRKAVQTAITILVPGELLFGQQTFNS